MFKPESEKWWTTIYYGERGSGKTLHQAKETLKILKYLKWLKTKYPFLRQGILYTNQKFCKNIEDEFLGDYLFYWDEQNIDKIEFCPRKKCWRGKKPHLLHGAYLIFDDVSTILPPEGWRETTIGLRKIFLQGRHLGVRVLANMQDPFACDINFRRTIKMAFRFNKIFSSGDPDETRLPIKRIYGVYIRRKIKAEFLWKFGDMTPEEIGDMKDALKAKKKVTGKNYFSGIWKAWPQWISRKSCEIYDTTQNVIGRSGI